MSKIELFNALGGSIGVVEDRLFKSGNNFVAIKADSLTPGIYSYRISTSDFSIMRKMTLLK